MTKYSNQENNPRAEQAFYVRILHVCLILYIMSVASCATTPNPEDIKKSDVHNRLAESYLTKQQFNEAFVELQKALKLNPDNKETLNYLGYVSTQFGNNKDAIAYYKRAISVDPNYSEAHNNLGVAYAEIEEWDNAISSFQSALRNPVYRTPASAYFNLGYVLYKKGEFVEAKDSLKESLVRNPTSPRAFYFLGLVYTELGDNDEAIENFSNAVGILPEYIDAHWELANAYLRDDDSDSALKHFRVVADKEKDPIRRREALEAIELFK